MNINKPDIPDEKVQFIEKHFIALLMDAVYFCDLSANSDLEDHEKQSFVKISILSAVFAVECAANLLLNLLPLSSKLKDQIDKIPTLEKYEFFLLFRNGSIVFDRGCKDVQTIQELIKFRNNQVHLYAKVLKGIKNLSQPMTFNAEEEKISSILKIPSSISRLEYVHAESALKSVDAFFEKYFIEWCKLTPNEVENILLDTLVSEQLKSAFVLQHPSYHAYVPAKTTKMGLRFGYLKPPIAPRS